MPAIQEVEKFFYKKDGTHASSFVNTITAEAEHIATTFEAEGAEAESGMLDGDW